LISLNPTKPAHVILKTLDELAYGTGEAILSLSEEVREELRAWLTETAEDDLLGMVRSGQQEAGVPREHPKATAEQIAIILDAQEEVSLDFTRFADQLTSWEADSLIKGLVAISEIQRQTGDRHFPLKALRMAIREYIQRNGPPPSQRRR
jgi:hypothetical protein